MAEADVAGLIAALFVQKNGVYFGLQNVDPWDEERDARRYGGPYPVVAHPPCSRWCALAPMIEAKYGHKVGDDGGCFESALRSVEKWGGVLEHPARSHAWKAFDLLQPKRGEWIASRHGWVTEVSQRAYGHLARKRTWLYTLIVQPPELDWSDPDPVATVSYMTNHGGGNLPRLTKIQASRTPEAFRDLLLGIARG